MYLFLVFRSILPVPENILENIRKIWFLFTCLSSVCLFTTDRYYHHLFDCFFTGRWSIRREAGKTLCLSVCFSVRRRQLWRTLSRRYLCLPIFLSVEEDGLEDIQQMLSWLICLFMSLYLPVHLRMVWRICG